MIFAPDEKGEVEGVGLDTELNFKICLIQRIHIGPLKNELF